MQIPFFNHWHPTLALRYLPMLPYIPRHSSVLEVGSGALGIGPYLRTKFTGVDLEFDGPIWPMMKRVKASAIRLPFKKDSFDVVVNSDMLEHLPAGKRQRAINEMVRVAKKVLIIGVPIGPKAHQQDKQLDAIYQQVHGYRHQFLVEQTQFGLPSVVVIEKSIKAATSSYRKSYHLKIIPNLNLSLRMWLMKGWISKNILANIFFRKVLLLAIPIMRLINHEPVYRKIFFIHLAKLSNSPKYSV